MSWWLWLPASLGALLVLYAAFFAWLVLLDRRDDARALVTFIPDSARAPPPQGAPAGTHAYLASPIDLVPDFIPVAGQLDDAPIVALTLRHLVRSSGEILIRELWPGPERSLTLILQLARPQGSKNPAG
jgi:Protein of unknown function (DUF1232)